MAYRLTVKKHYHFKTKAERDQAAKIAARDLKGAIIKKSKRKVKRL